MIEQCQAKGASADERHQRHRYYDDENYFRVRLIHVLGLKMVANGPFYARGRL